MALTVNFTTSQVYGSPSQIVFADTSTGTDAAVVSRKIYMTDESGDPVVVSGTTTSYELWSGFPGTTGITLAALIKDMALNIRVDWVNISGTVLYTKTVLTHFPVYAKDYYIFLIKAQSSNRKLKTHANFYPNLIKLIVEIKVAYDSIALIYDISSCQAALDRAKELIDNPANFF